MNSPVLVPLVLFALWALLLLFAIAMWRTGLVLRREVKINAFPSGSEHGSSHYWRLNRAHANAVENLPIFAAIALSGAFVGVAEPLFVTLAWWVFAARVVQSAVHIGGNAPINVQLRFTALLVQIGAMAWMAILVLA